MGKGNIELPKGSLLSVTFTKGSERLRLCLKDDILESPRRVSSVEESKRISLVLADKPIRELFNVEG